MLMRAQAPFVWRCARASVFTVERCVPLTNVTSVRGAGAKTGRRRGGGEERDQKANVAQWAANNRPEDMNGTGMD